MAAKRTRQRRSRTGPGDTHDGRTKLTGKLVSVKIEPLLDA
jgi:hypothetical protein